MQAGEHKLGALLLQSVLAGDGAHAQAALQHQPLPNLDAILQILGQIAPTHHLQLTRWIIGPQSLQPHRHLGHWRLVVLGVPQLGCLQHLHFKQAVIHAPFQACERPS